MRLNQPDVSIEFIHVRGSGPLGGQKFLNTLARTRRTKIGLGNDVVDDWRGRCGPEIELIVKFLKRVGEEEIKANWFEVLAGIPGISNREVKRLHIEGKYDILKLLEVLPGVNVDYQPWGGDMPGRDGIWMDVYTRSKEGTNVLKALKLIVSRLRSSHTT
jgi:hypothetical protein